MHAMTATTTDVQDAPARRFSRRRVVFVLLLLAVVAAAWWVTHPRVYLGVGNAFMGPVPVGTRAYLRMEVIPQDGIVLHGASPAGGDEHG